MRTILLRPGRLALAIAACAGALPALAQTQSAAPAAPAPAADAGPMAKPVARPIAKPAPGPAADQATKPAAKAADATRAPAPIQTVQVRGAAARYDARRDDTASKTVLDAEEIRKYGDTNIYDVLKRAPGVTITGGNQLRMRGLGAGYTQILVNGDRPPPGFSLDTLTPDQIERIEIVKAASAEYSMQAIAGTINIILRKMVTKPQRDARIAYNRTPQSRGLNLSGTYGERIGDLSYFLNGSAWGGSSEFTQTGADQMTDPNGVVTEARTSRYEGQGPYRGLVLFPRLSWKADERNELNLSVGLQADSSSWGGSSHNDDTVGSFGDPDWIDSANHSDSSHWMVRGEANWVAKIAGGKLDLTVSAERSRSDSDQVSDQTTAQNAPGGTRELARDWDDVQRNGRLFARAKFTRSVFDDHALGAGFEASRQDNDETRLRRERQTGLPDTDILEDFDPRITRVAGYVQDEWNILPRWSMYLGGRWEGIQTDSAATGEPETVNRNHVLSPVLQTLYKLPGAKQQVRLALTRTYKAPSTDQLTARRYIAAENTRFTPDSSGNPALRPELANGIDLAYENFWAPGALVALSASQRDISDYIRTGLGLDADGRWLYQPFNDGDATVRSLEAEIKLPLQLVSDLGKGIDLRASLTRNWSEVSTVPGPDNRLDAQTPESATFGVDYRRDRFSMGASLAYQQGGWVRISDEQSSRQQTRKDLDAYALWKLDARFQLRLSLANILGMDNTSERGYADDSGTSRQWSYQRGWMRTGLNLEMKL